MLTTPRLGKGLSLIFGFKPRCGNQTSFVEAHNVIRRQLNEPPLTWDRNLARYARRWATKQLDECKMMHSFGPYGENIFWGGQDHWTATDAVESWARENQFYDPMTNQCLYGEMCGHYTQVVWRSSLRVGCARMKCHNGGVLVYCEYDPPGNYINENPFGKVFEMPSSTTSSAVPLDIMSTTGGSG
uniref:SCP domain-containing protein n=1 Tax=Cannabis sativa TaxID=3483 RepID=A0A803P541_CANSA